MSFVDEYRERRADTTKYRKDVLSEAPINEFIEWLEDNGLDSYTLPRTDESFKDNLPDELIESEVYLNIGIKYDEGTPVSVGVGDIIAIDPPSKESIAFLTNLPVGGGHREAAVNDRGELLIKVHFDFI